MMIFIYLFLRQFGVERKLRHVTAIHMIVPPDPSFLLPKKIFFD